jgi:hypothetical protein
MPKFCVGWANKAARTVLGSLASDSPEAVLVVADNQVAVLAAADSKVGAAVVAGTDSGLS